MMKPGDALSAPTFARVLWRMPLPWLNWRLAATCRLLAGNPFGEGDYVTKDQAGRTLQNLLIEDWVVTYWADHAVKELRITEIVQV